MTARQARRWLLLGLLLTAVALIVATISGESRLGPLVFWSVHETVDATGSTVALRPGLGLAAMWLGVWLGAVLVAVSRTRRDT